MATEIERKFLVIGDDWRTDNPVPVTQGYLNGNMSSTAILRVRRTKDRGYIVVKSQVKGECSRSEYEYEIPVEDATEMLDNLIESDKKIVKQRHNVMYKGKHWEVDEFFEANDGLIIAEIELASEDEEFEKPPWLGEEVTHDKRYYNAYIAEHPFPTWDPGAVSYERPQGCLDLKVHKLYHTIGEACPCPQEMVRFLTEDYYYDNLLGLLKAIDETDNLHVMTGDWYHEWIYFLEELGGDPDKGNQDLECILKHMKKALQDFKNGI